VVDVDPGNHRTGVTSPDQAVALAQAIAANASLRLGGIQFYCGSQQHIARFADRRAAIIERTDYLRGVLDSVRAAGLEIPTITGGGTGTFMIDAELGVLSELQVGSYIFLDRDYRDCDLSGGDAPSFEPALFVDATVVSANTPGMATIDAGLKALATDSGVPAVVDGAPTGSAYRFLGDEHGAILSDIGPLPAPGARVTLLTPHCDPTVNLYDAYHVIDDSGAIGEIWPVSARGRST